jgi:hypothetical protein
MWPMSPWGRHLRSVLIAIPVGVLVWITVGLGVAQFGRGLGGFYFGETVILPDEYVPDRGVRFAIAASLLIVAGLLYTGLLEAKLSPPGPTAVAVAYAGISIWAMAEPASFGETFPSDLFGVERAAQAPTWGFALLLAGPLAFVAAPGRPWLPGRVYIASAPLVWLAVAGGLATLINTVGVYGLGEGLVLASDFDPPRRLPLLNGLASVLLLVVAGLLYLLMLRGGRRSIGLPVVGLAFLAASVVALVDPELLLPPASLYGTDLAAALNALVRPAWCYALLLAVPLLSVPAYAAVADRSARPAPVAPSPGLELSP